jgi:hypothetical protein
LVINILLHVSEFENAIIGESNTILVRYVPKVVGSREGRELYIVTGGVMVTYLTRIVFDSLMMAF